MANWSPRKVPEHIAGELAEYYSIGVDLRLAKAYCERVKRERQDPTKPSQEAFIQSVELQMGLQEAAVVRYARCFTQGKRVRLDEGWLAGDERLVAAHRRCM